MKALILSGPRQLGVRDIPEPAPGPGEVLVQVAFGGICGTDLRLYRGTKVVPYPRVIGHEFAGRIAASGPGVGDWAVGQRVVVYPTVSCGACYACLAGRPNICVRRRTIGYEWDGGFAEYVVIPAQAVGGGNVIAIPDALSDEEAALTEPVAAALMGIRRGGVTAGSQVLIFGAGPIGLAHVQLSRLAGATTVAVSEPQPARREAALAVGAAAAIDPSADSLAAVVQRIFGEPGPDIAFVDVGVPALVPTAVGLLRKGGRCVIFAGMAEGATSVLEPNTIHYREIDLVGSSSSTPQNQAEVLRSAVERRIDLRALLSDVLALEDWSAGFEMKDQGDGLKVLLDPRGR